MPRPLSMAATRDSIRIATAMAGRAHVMADDAFGVAAVSARRVKKTAI